MSKPGTIERVVIVGAGAMGCLFAAKLGRSGVDVTLVDIDPARMALIDAEGLRLHDDSGEQVVRVRAMAADTVRGAVDLVILFTKGIHTRSAAASVRHLAAEKPAVLTLQNGAGNAELIAQAFPEECIVVGTAHVPADIHLPNTVHSSGFGHLAVGNFRPGEAGHAPAVAEALRKAGFQTELSEDVDAVVWEKLAFNAALNALAMVTRSSNGEMDNPFARRIARQLVVEAVRVAEARGTKLDEAQIISTVERALAEHPGHKASMLQDREAGRATEIDFINGAVIREGERLGIATPAHAIIYDLVKFAELKDQISV